MKNVLIIDDEQSLLFSMKAGFEPLRNDLRLHTAENGKEGIRILDSIPIDVVVTDLKMPVMDGFEVLSHMSTHHPGIPAMVMTAFNTPEIEDRLNQGRKIVIFEKPVDFDELVKAILHTVNKDDSGGLSGIALSSFMQLIHSDMKSCLLEVRAGGKTGYIYFREGKLLNAVYDGIKGEEAVYRLLLFNDVRIGLKNLPRQKLKKLIDKNLMQLLMEGMRRKDEAIAQGNTVESSIESDDTEEPLLLTVEVDSESTIEDNSPSASESTESPVLENDLEEDAENSEQHDQEKGEKRMSDMKAALEKLKAVEGFMAAGAFSPSGEVVASVNTSDVNLPEIGALANDVLLKAQKATEVMGVGRGQLVHIEAPKAHIFARCLNESTDFAATTSGRAHVHMVMVLDKEGSIGMGKMRLESVIQEIAPQFR